MRHAPQIFNNIDMDSVRTSSLFHYTDMNALKRILLDGLVPNYCSEDLSVDGTEIVIGIPMICFCDIPLTRTSEFCSRYGNHAIGLSKDWAMRNGVNPILYAADNDVIISLSFYRNYEMMLLRQVRNAGGNPHSLRIELTNPNSVNNIVPFVNHHIAQAANRKLFGYVKRYESEWQGKPLVNYIENEWRYVVDDIDNTLWFWNKDDYMNWRGDVNEKKPVPNDELKARKLTFRADDITHIIVQTEEQVLRMIRFISNLKQIGGIVDNVSDSDQKILISKIISQERISKDF